MTDESAGPPLAARPGVDDPKVLVVGGEAAKAVALHLQEACEVRILSSEERIVRWTEGTSIEARAVDVTAGRELRRHAGPADAAVVVTERDQTALLVTQLLRFVCDVAHVAVLLNDPHNRDAFEGVDADLLDGRAVFGPVVEESLAGAST